LAPFYETTIALRTRNWEYFKQKIRRRPLLFKMATSTYETAISLISRVRIIKQSFNHQTIKHLMRQFSVLVFETFIGIINSVLFYYFRLKRALKKNTKVKSVLQLSIISHKQFMLSRVMRNLGLESRFLALNFDIARTLDIGFDYGIPYHMHPAKRKLLEAYYLWTVLARYDVIHSHFGAFLTDDGREFKYLKRLG